MRKDIQNDIEKITFFLNSMERKSVFICINLENYDIISFQDFSNLKEKEKNDNDWIWLKIVKKENNQTYISQVIIENKEKIINNKNIEDLKNYTKFLLKCI
jgi:hypothetical protein